MRAELRHTMQLLSNAFSAQKINHTSTEHTNIQETQLQLHLELSNMAFVSELKHLFHYVKYHDQGLIRKVNNMTRQLQEKNDSNPQTLFVPLGLELLQDVKEVIVNTRRR